MFVSNKDVGTKLFDRLGEIMYVMSDNVDIVTHLIKKFIEEFKEEKKFIEYFQKTWCQNERRIGKSIKISLYFICIHIF